MISVQKNLKRFVLYDKSLTLRLKKFELKNMAGSLHVGSARLTGPRPRTVYR